MPLHDEQAHVSYPQADSGNEPSAATVGVRLTRAAPAALVVLLGWLTAVIMPLTSGAFWLIAVAPGVWHERAVRFTTDPISSLPIDGAQWVVQPWLPALLVWGTWEGGGATALSVVNGVVAAGTMYLLYRCAALYAPRLAAACVTITIFPLLLANELRSERFALLLFAALALELRGARWWWSVPFIIAVWANVHGSVPIGLALCGAAALRLLRPTAAGNAWVLDATATRRAVWLAVCASAAFFSPLGFDLIAYIHDVQRIPDVAALTPVWRPLDPVSWRGAYVLALLAAIGIPLSRGRARETLPPLLPIMVLAALAFDASRNVIWLAAACVPELAVVASRLWHRRTFPENLESRLIASTLAVAVMFALIGLRPGGAIQRELSHTGLPSERQLSKVHTDDQVLAIIDLADYLHVQRGARVYVDARLERYRAGDLRAYRQRIARATALRGCEPGQDFDAVLIRPDAEEPAVHRCDMSLR